MSEPLRVLRVLIVEDSEDDARLEIEALRRHGFEPHYQRVGTAGEMTAALDRAEWDVILCDYSLPRFNGLEAIALFLSRGIELPFILVSDTLGEETAVEGMRAGAHDFVLKEKLWRLGPTVERELREAEVRRESRRTEAALRESERKYRSLVGGASDAIVLADQSGTVVEANSSALAMTGYDSGDLGRTNIVDFIDPDELRTRPLRPPQIPGASTRARRTVVRKNGSHFPVDLTTTLLEDGRLLVIVRDMTEQVEIEEALRRSEFTMREAQRIAHIGSWCWHADEDRFEGSDESYRILGLDPQSEHPSTARIRELIAPESRETLRAVMEQFAAGHAGEGDLTIITPEGRRRFAHAQGEPESGAPTGKRRVFGYLQDITELRETVTRLRQSEEQLVRAQRIAGIGSWEMDLETGGRAWSEQVFRIMNLPIGEPPPEDTVFARIHKDDREAVRLAHKNAIATGVTQQVEHRMTIGDGSVQIFTIYIEPAKNTAGKVVKLTGTVQNVTALRRAEQSLRQSEKRLRDLVESANDAILTLDGTGKVLDANPAAGRMIGEPSADFIGRHITGSIHPDHVERVAAGLAKVIETGHVTHINAPVRTATGSYVEIEATASRELRSGTDEVFVIARDVTEKQLLQRELERATRLAGLGRVASSMSHEFNNVLMGIQPFAEILARKSTETKAVNAANHIMQSVQRGRRVTQDVLRFTRLTEPVRRRVEVQKWMADSVGELRLLVPANVQVDLALPSTPLAATVDREQIMQVISNLVMNARDAIGVNNGRITISANRPAEKEAFGFGIVPDADRFVHFCIRDDGPGMAPTGVQRAFEPFYTTKKGGTGLGLAIAHQIVQLHGGHIFIESSPGHGTEVHFFVPAATEAEHAPEPQPLTSGALPKSVLLVEDEDIVAVGITAMLETEGIDVHLCATAATALQYLQTHQPEALILDVGLPDMNGMDLYERIREKLPRLPVVFSSGHADQARIDAFAQSAPVSLVLKPYDSDKLFAELEKACNAAAALKTSS